MGGRTHKGAENPKTSTVDLRRDRQSCSPIKRFVQRNVETLIANAIINDKVKFGSTITIDFQDNKLILNKDNINLVKVNFGKYSYELTNDEYNLYFKSPSSLTTNIANDVYAFNDRLIEYLT